MTITNKKGFTLIELLVVISLIAILSSVFLPRFLDLSEKRINLVVEEVWTITEAIQTFDSISGNFPDGASNCVNAISTMVSSSLLSENITTNTTPWGADSNYTFSCTPNQATISINGVANKWLSYIYASIPNASLTADSVIVTVQKLAYVPVLSNFLYLDPSNNTYQVASNTDIVLLGREPSATLARAVFYQGLVSIKGTQTAIVTLPNCTTGTSPEVYAAINTINFDTVSANSITTTAEIIAITTDSTTTFNVVTATITPISWGVDIATNTTEATISITLTIAIRDATIFVSTKCR